MWALGFLSAVLAALLVRRREARDVFIGAAVGWHLVAIALAFALPGASYLFVFPAIVMTIGVVTRLYELAPVAAAIVIFPLALMLHTALGRTGFAPTAVLIALVGTTFAFLFANRAAALALTFVAVALAMAVFAGPRRSSESPTPRELQEPLVETAGTRSGNRITLRIRSPREADIVSASFEPAVRVLTVNGVAPAPLNPRRRPRPPVVTVYGSEAVVELESAAPVEVTVSDRTFGPDVTTTRRTVRY